MASLDILQIRRLTKNWKIVSVDDDHFTPRILQRAFNYYGVEIYEAHDGQEGLNLIKQVQPTIVVSDLSMPVMSGWELLKAIREDSRMAHLPVVALTAHAMIDVRERVLSAGFDQYITKPFRPLELVLQFVDWFAERPVPIPVGHGNGLLKHLEVAVQQ
jgi:CheY-like chemotaxis protein